MNKHFLHHLNYKKELENDSKLAKSPKSGMLLEKQVMLASAFGDLLIETVSSFSNIMNNSKGLSHFESHQPVER